MGAVESASKKLNDKGREMLAMSRRTLNWFDKNFGDKSFAAVSKGDLVFIVAKGERGNQLRKVALDWQGKVDEIEVWG